jgi:hypothetical protein
MNCLEALRKRYNVLCQFNQDRWTIVVSNRVSMVVKKSPHSNSSPYRSTRVGQSWFTMVEVHFSFDRGSIVISESSTCSNEAYDYTTPHNLYYTRITKETQ